MKYPNGVRKNITQNNITYHNRGMSLEADINMTNQYYLDVNRGVIHKKPTPVQIVNVHYPKRSAAVITEGYFKQASTTDYNGIYRGKYIDFEAKETKSRTSFPLSNFHEHQMNHLKSVHHHGAICFIIIRFTVYNETYLLTLEKLLSYWNDQFNGGKKSISYGNIKEYGYLIPFKYQVRVDYLDIVDQIYFK